MTSLQKMCRIYHSSILSTELHQCQIIWPNCYLHYSSTKTMIGRPRLCQNSRILLESIPILIIIYSDQVWAFLHSHDPARSMNELGPVAFSFTAKT